jgi:hypothetical protein
MAVSENTARKALAEAEASGLLRVRRSVGGRNRPHVYAAVLPEENGATPEGFEPPERVQALKSLADANPSNGRTKPFSLELETLQNGPLKGSQIEGEDVKAVV